jgi:hypothetical protein
MKKYKSIAIPLIHSEDVPRFLTVRDRRFKEWIFVTGGCKRREIYNPLKCALRELEEETRGLINIKEGEYTHYSFIVKETSYIELEYNVFIFHIKMSRSQQFDTIKKFDVEKEKMHQRKIPYKKAYDENDLLSFDTLKEFNLKKRWDRIIKNVIQNPSFYECIASTERKKFIIL